MRLARVVRVTPFLFVACGRLGARWRFGCVGLRDRSGVHGHGALDFDRPGRHWWLRLRCRSRRVGRCLGPREHATLFGAGHRLRAHQGSFRRRLSRNRVGRHIGGRCGLKRRCRRRAFGGMLGRCRMARCHTVLRLRTTVRVVELRPRWCGLCGRANRRWRRHRIHGGRGRGGRLHGPVRRCRARPDCRSRAVGFARTHLLLGALARRQARPRDVRPRTGTRWWQHGAWFQRAGRRSGRGHWRRQQRGGTGRLVREFPHPRCLPKLRRGRRNRSTLGQYAGGHDRDRVREAPVLELARRLGVVETLVIWVTLVTLVMLISRA